MHFQLQVKRRTGQNQGFQNTFWLEHYVSDKNQNSSSTECNTPPSEPFRSSQHMLGQKLDLRAVTSLLSALQRRTYTAGNSHLAAVFVSFTVRALLSDELSVMPTPVLDGLILPDDGDWDRGEAALHSGFRLSLQSMKSPISLHIQHSWLSKGLWQCKWTTDN
jgi:hypothetical protein